MFEHSKWSAATGMNDFFSASLKFQQMAFQAWTATTSLMIQAQMRLLEQQFALLDHMHAHRRSDDPATAAVNPKIRKRKGRKPASPCCGPDLLDHYGKRAHDVDVEHI